MTIPKFVDIEDLQDLIEIALREDIGTGDVTSNSTIDASAKATAVFSSKENGVVAGIELANIVFEMVDSRLDVEWEVSDGDRVERGQELGTIKGNARHILLAERVVLNFMQRMSGIATATRKMVDEVADFPAEILDTRKTLPGFRSIDKWSVLIGGGVNHRFGLHDMILIKDNHIAAAGSVTKALEKADGHKRSLGRSIPIEIEAKTLAQVREIVESDLADVVMLDNMSRLTDAGTVDTSTLEDALDIVDDKIRTEASGNVTIDTVRAIAATGVDSISSGALTHSVRALDISLNVVLKN